MTESFVHVVMRDFLKKEGWTLVAGEYPGGSDDELYVLSIMDPTVACDNSPNPRKHSKGEVVPDLLAFKDGLMLVIEAKPKYSLADKEKLRDLLVNKHKLLCDSLTKFCFERGLLRGVNFEKIRYIPVLAFGNEKYKVYDEEVGFAHIYIKSLNEAKIVFF